MNKSNVYILKSGIINCLPTNIYVDIFTFRNSNKYGSINICGELCEFKYNGSNIIKKEDYEYIIYMGNIPIVVYDNELHIYTIVAQFNTSSDRNKMLRFIQRYHDGHHYRLTIAQSELYGDISDAIALLLILKRYSMKIPKFVIFEILKHNMSSYNPGIIYSKFK